MKLVHPVFVPPTVKEVVGSNFGHVAGQPAWFGETGTNQAVVLAVLVVMQKSDILRPIYGANVWCEAVN